MSDKLYEMLCKRFPPVGPKGYTRVSIYPPGEEKLIEGIHLNLIEKVFLSIKKPLLNSEVIESLASHIFNDIHYDFYKNQEEGDVILFRPREVDDYAQRYANHYIAIHHPLKYPKITISTGNRGRTELNSRQREKYYQFVIELNDLFLEKAKS